MLVMASEFCTDNVTKDFGKRTHQVRVIHIV
jgi:hypothetical protein